MSKLKSDKNFNHGSTSSIGVLIVNLGTPENTSTAAVRKYLRQFLSDSRVIEVPKIIWWFILNIFILPFRPAKSAKAYGKIWMKEGSPLLIFSNEIRDKLQDLFDETATNQKIHIELAMSYGQPSIKQAIDNLIHKSARKIFLLPMYPQYSSTTTGSVFENITKELSRLRWIPEFRYLNHYHDEREYIETISKSIKKHWGKNGRGERLLFSFHGLPQKMLLDGDPYHCQCYKTARLISKKLSLNENDWFVSFQSRLGPTKWLKPYTDETLKSWGESQSGIIDVICPGFSVDCLETLEEIAMENNELYQEAGGKEVRYISALNSEKDHITFLYDLISKNISDWKKEDEMISPDEIEKELKVSRDEALKKGAKK